MSENNLPPDGLLVAAKRPEYDCRVGGLGEIDKIFRKKTQPNYCNGYFCCYTDKVLTPTGRNASIAHKNGTVPLVRQVCSLSGVS